MKIRPEQQRAEDAVEKHAVLVLRRDAEVAEDQDEDEDVVDRQRLLDEKPVRNSRPIPRPASAPNASRA